MIARSFLVVGLFLLAGACEGNQDPPLPSTEPVTGLSGQQPGTGAPTGADTISTPDAPAAALVDTAIAPAVAGEDGWSYAQRSDADLDGDGQAEQVVLTARVELYQGRPAWDDGQPWQVYVEEADGKRTYLYARYVQLGTVTLRVGLPEGNQRASVILLEHVPDRLALYEVEYLGPDSVDSFVRFERTVDPRGETASPVLP